MDSDLKIILTYKIFNFDFKIYRLDLDVPSVEELHVLLEQQDEVIFELSKQLEDTRLELQDILSAQKVSSSDEEIMKSKPNLIDAHLLVEIKEKLTELADVLLQLKVDYLLPIFV
jgi:hypothetical protein